MRANDFEASKHQRQIVNRFNNFIQEGDENFDKDIAARQKESQAAVKGESATTTAEAGSNQSTTSEDSVTTITAAAAAAAPSTSKKQKPRKAPKNVATDLRTRIRSSEYLHSPDITSWKHRLRVCT
jgi:hypothetical protein